MSYSRGGGELEQARHWVEYVVFKFLHSFMDITSTFSIASLLSALLIAIAFIRIASVIRFDML